MKCQQVMVGFSQRRVKKDSEVAEDLNRKRSPHIFESNY